MAAGDAFGSSRLTDDQTVDSLERARRRRRSRLGRVDDTEDTLGRLTELKEGIESAFDWTGSTVDARERRESAEIELLELQVEQSEEDLEAARAQNALEEGRMALENRDTARQSFIGLAWGLLRIARSTVLFIVLTWVVVHVLGLFGASTVHLSSLQFVLDRLESYLLDAW